jgi:KaiC/GvpD/RAD55 family RecA-like ATPase
MIPGRLHLLTGGPGTGKSTACYHFLQAGLQAGETVALLTLDRLSDLVTHARCVGLDLKAAVGNRKLGLLRFRSDFARYLSSSGSPYRALDDLWTMIVDIKPDRIVVDPVSPFLSESTASGAAVATLAQLMDGFGVTTLLTYPGDVTSAYDARLNAIVQRCALILHLAREQSGTLRLQVVQNRTSAAPVEPVRFQLLPDAGISALQIVPVEPTKPRRSRTKRAPQIVEQVIEVRETSAGAAPQSAYLEIVRSS